MRARDTRPGRGRWCSTGLAIAAIASALALRSSIDWSPAASGEDASPLPASAPSTGRGTPGVRVALHLDEPIEPGKSVVWTAAFQAAWDRMRESSPKFRDGISLGPPASPEAVRALNTARLAPGVVEPDAMTIVAG